MFPPGASLRPPSSRSRPPRQGLSITTHPPSLSRHTSSSSSSQHAASIGKKPVPPNKRQHAAKLLSEFRMKEGLAQRSPDPNATSPSSIGSFGAPGLPGPLTNGSRSSKGKTTLSYDAAPSDMSSVMSFDTSSQYSGKSGGRNEVVSYHGHTVPQRTRKKYDPVGKAKTALIRYLGACQKCRGSNVTCPLEHHDIESLEPALQPSPIKKETDSQCYNSDSPVHKSQIANTSSGQATPVTSHGHIDLQGIGHSFDAAPELPLDPELIFSPVGDLDPSPSQNIYRFSAPVNLEARITDHYSLVQNGGQFPLGFWDVSTYKCYFLDGECQQSFLDEESLQAHFETDHFEFTRIDPCFRCICTKCCWVKTTYACDCGGMVKMFVCGNFIRNAQYPPEPPIGQFYHQTGFNTPTIFWDSSFSNSDLNGLGFNVNGAQNFDNSANTSFYDDNSNMYPSHNAGGSDTYTYDSTQPGGNRYNGYAWTLTQRTNKAATVSIRYCVKKFKQGSKHQKMLRCLLLSLMIITIGVQVLYWVTSILSKLNRFLPSIPALGYMGFVVLNWAAINIYSIYKAKRCKMRQCPLHAFTPLVNQYGQSAPPVLMHARVS